MSVERLPHHFDGRIFAGPDFESFRALIQEHAEAVGGFATGGFGGSQQGRFGGAINHVVNSGGLFERKSRTLNRQRIVRLEAKRSRVEQEIDLSFWNAEARFDRVNR